MRNRGFVLLLLTAVVVLARGPAAWACACDPSITKHEPAAVQKEYKASFAVFTGMVGSVDLIDENARVTFAVRDVFKGEVSNPYVVNTPASADDCGIDFVPGKHYDVLVKLSKNLPTTELCSGTDVSGFLAKAGYTDPRTEYPENEAASAAGLADDTSSGDRGARAGAIGAAVLLLVLIAAIYTARARTRARIRATSRRRGSPR